jgi:hypothetical protein
METTERIVEAYVRYVRRWFTLPNVRCSGQLEIDLLAIDTTTRPYGRYHIETGVSISGGFSKLTALPFSVDDLKTRVKAPAQRRTIDFFVERKFQPHAVRDKLLEYGFTEANHRKVIVSWGWTDDARSLAEARGITLWHLGDLMHEIAELTVNKRIYFTDDTMRTLQLMAMGEKRHASKHKQERSANLSRSGSRENRA